jgi:hypothetical protein
MVVITFIQTRNQSVDKYRVIMNHFQVLTVLQEIWHSSLWRKNRYILFADAAFRQLPRCTIYHNWICQWNLPMEFWVPIPHHQLHLVSEIEMIITSGIIFVHHCHQKCGIRMHDLKLKFFHPQWMKLIPKFFTSAAITSYFWTFVLYTALSLVVILTIQ